jgi:uncharacterized membrane protein YdbT with pleckstrin-like domain
MLYVQQSLSPGEEIVCIGHFPWMYTAHAISCIVWGVIGCIAIIMGAIYLNFNFGHNFDPDATLLQQIRELHPGIRLGAFFVFLMGLFKFAHMMVVRASTEVAVTSSRIIYKRGLVARYVGELSIDRIEGVNVIQTFLGRIFGYGRIMVRGMGVGEVILPPLANPIEFRKAIEKARTV